MWAKIKAVAQRTCNIYLVAITVAVGVIAGNFLSLFNVLEWELRDGFFRFRITESIDQEIIVVTIDEQDIQAAGDWPIPDELLAELLQKVDQQSPRAFGLDIYRDLPEEPGHEELVETFRAMPKLIGVEKIIGNRVNPPPVLEELGQVGIADLVLDGDRKVRRALLTAVDDQRNGDIRAGLATRVALKYLEAEGIELTLADAEQQKFLLGKASFVPLKPNEAGYSKQAVGGYQLLMNWWGGPENFVTVSMADVLSGEVEADVMRDRMVFIGTVAGLAGWQESIRLLVWSLTGAGSSWIISSRQQHQQQYYFHKVAFLSVFGMSVLLIGGAYLAFLHGWLVPVATPFLAFLMSGVITTNAYRQQQLKATNLDLQVALEKLQESKLQLVQHEKMSALGNLVAGVAHEINNPIGFLNGSVANAQNYLQDLTAHIEVYQETYAQPSEMVEDHAEEIDLDYVREDFPKLLDSMHGAMARIKAISTSLRTFSRADTKDKVSADLHEGLNSTLLILKYRLKANEHRPAIEIVKDYGNLPTINCFLGQLNQVFMNLLANAIDVFDEMAQQLSFEALKDKPQIITVKTALCEEQNAVEICIGDNGKGMTEEVKARIFEHLFTTKGVGKGTGLGLAIAKQIIVEAHGGKLEVQSELGKGTEFRIQLPLST